MVIRDYASFYSLGPQQGFGPDSTLRVNDRVRLLRREFGYSRVELADGRMGFVANDEIAPAPPAPEPLDEPDPAPAPRGTSPDEQPYLGPELPDIPLPELDLDIAAEDVPPPSEDIPPPDEDEAEPRFRP